jgi:hypothetical protein
MAGQGTVSIKAYEQPLGYEQILSATLVTPTQLNAPAYTKVAYIQVESGQVRYRDDGVDPTAAIGMLLVDGAVLEYAGDLSELTFIEESGTPKLNVSYYK